MLPGQPSISRALRGLHEPAQLANAVRFELWRREVQICELTGERDRWETLMEKLAGLGRADARYTVQASDLQAQFLMYQSRYREALQLAADALPLAEDQGAKEQLAGVLAVIGWAQYHLSDYAQAVEFRQRAGALWHELGMTVNEADMVFNIGMCYWRMGRYNDALEHFQRAEHIYAEGQDLRNMASCKASIANILLALDDPDRAYQMYREALTDFRKVGDVFKQSTVLNNIAAIMIRRNQFDQGKDFLEQGIQIDRTVGNLSGHSTKLGNLAVLQAMTGQHAEALANFKQALAIDRQTGNLHGQMTKLSNMADLYGLMLDPQRCYDNLEAALGIARKIDAQSYVPHIMANMINPCVSLGRLDEAERLGREALDLAGDTGNASVQSKALTNMAELYRTRGDLPTALEYSRQAIGILESQAAFEAPREEAFYNHYLILQQLGRTPEALSYLEKAYRGLSTKLAAIPDQRDRDRLLSCDQFYATLMAEWARVTTSA